MHNSNCEDIQSQSSKRKTKTKTLRNTFNIQNSNQLLELFTNNYQIIQKMSNTQELNSIQDIQEKGIAQDRENKLQSESIKQNPKESKSVEKVDQREEIIKKLQRNNKIIADQVQLIWQKLKQQPEKVKKERKQLIQTEMNQEKLEKDLKNAYQWIKIAQKQIDRYHKKQKSSLLFIQKMKKFKHDQSEREVIINRLKNQILAKNKEIKANQKSIISKYNQTENGSQFNKLSQEVNYLYQLLQQTEKKEVERVNVLKTQYTKVKKYERDLIQKGMSQFELQQMKKRCIRQFPTKAELLNRQKTVPIHQISNSSSKDRKDPPQKQHNHKNLSQMINQIQFLQKKQGQFDREYRLNENVKRQYKQKNKELLQKINQYQIEIEELETLNQKLRSKHIQQHRLRKNIKTLQNQTNNKQKKSLNKNQFNKQKLLLNISKNKRYKSLPNTNREKIRESIQKVNNVTKKWSHLYGEAGQNCNKFNDKYVLGKQHQGKKIIELTLYFQPLLNYICGISVTYQTNLKGGQYVWRTTDNQQLYKIQNIECGEGYIRDIFPQFQKQEGKSRLVGIEIELNSGIHKTFGKIVNYKQKLSLGEYIGCIYGSMSIQTCKQGITLSNIEQLGFQIYS